MSTNEALSLNKKLTLTGALSALVIVLGITKLGFITLGAASITILHIPVILICMLAGLPEGLFVGATFGILSLIQAAMSTNGGLDPLFVNPLVSVLPRMLIAVIAWGLWKALNLIPHMPKAVSAGIKLLIHCSFLDVFIFSRALLFVKLLVEWDILHLLPHVD